MLLSEQKEKRRNQKEKDSERLKLKSKLFTKMSKSTVEVNGKVFWADPESEQNFAGRIRDMEERGLVETEWIQGGDILKVTLDELKEVYRLGTLQIAAFWDKYIADVKALGGKE